MRLCFLILGVFYERHITLRIVLEKTYSLSFHPFSGNLSHDVMQIVLCHCPPFFHEEPYQVNLPAFVCLLLASEARSLMDQNHLSITTSTLKTYNAAVRLHCKYSLCPLRALGTRCTHFGVRPWLLLPCTLLGFKEHP